jgi:hypothetical protein
LLKETFMRAKIRLTFLTVAVAALAIVALVPTAARARTEYKEAFAKNYADKVKPVDCNLCHDKKAGKNKKIRNEYGKAVGTALGAKSVDDEDKIIKALKEAEKSKAKGAKETFGELIEAGKRPAG